MSSSGFHNKYRPTTLPRVLGNERVVASLSNYIETGKYPSAVFISGPTSSGKTTLARAFASSALGTDAESSQNFEDVNFSESRTIDDVRSLISMSRLKPWGGGRRFILCDEAQGILSNAPAANAFLKPLEEPSPTTTWILSSMEPDKFRSTELGRAIFGRCVKFSLNAPTEEDLLKQGARISKAEKLGLSKAELTSIVEAGDKTYRGLAAQLEIFSTLHANDREEALAAATEYAVSADETPDDILIQKFVVYLLRGDVNLAVRACSAVKDGVQFLMKLGYYSWFLLCTHAHGGKRSSAWGTKPMWQAWSAVSKIENLEPRLAAFHSAVIGLRLQAGVLSVSGQQAAAALACDSLNWKS